MEKVKKKRRGKGLPGVVFLGVLFLICCHSPGHRRPSGEGQMLDSLLQIVRDSTYTNPSHSHKILEQALRLSVDSLHYYKVLAAKSRVYIMNNAYDSGFVLNKQILEYSRRVPMSADVHVLLGTIDNSVGVYYSLTDRNDSALYYYEEACRHMQAGGLDGKLPDLFINMSDVYARKGAYDQRASYLRKALFISDSLGIMDRMAFPLYYALGETYMELRDFEQADAYYLLAEKDWDKCSLNEQFLFCNSRGNYYYYKEEYDQALPWFHQALALVVPTQMGYFKGICEVNLGEMYVQLNQPDSAQYYLDRSFSYFLTHRNKTALYHISTLKAALALKRNQPEEAFRLLSSYTDTTGIAPNMIAIRNRNLQAYYAASGNYRQAYERLQQNGAIDNAIRAERTQKRVAEIDMRYRQDTTLLKREAVIREQRVAVDSLETTRLLWILASAFLLALACFIYFYMKKQRSLQWHRYFGQITKLKMENVRNRISPHFILNVLKHEISASEKELVRQTELAGLVKLLRSSLDIAEKLSIPLQEELDFVYTYIQVESRALEPDFELDWEISSALDTQAILVPAMMIQIPVENALKHGLRGREGKKLLRLLVTPAEGGISVRIEDNGSGLHPVCSRTDRSGTGLKIVYRTIQLLNIKNRNKLTFSMRNKDQMGESGVVSAFFIPYVYNYTI